MPLIFIDCPLSYQRFFPLLTDDVDGAAADAANTASIDYLMSHWVKSETN